jgi:hypothetical protein
MKKLITASSLLVLLSCHIASAQIKIGLNISPTINFNRVGLLTSDKGYDIASDGASLGFIGGPEVSFFFGSASNYSVTFGLWYAVKHGKYTRTTPTTMPDNSIVLIDSTRKTILQYLQIPVTFKLYTNEISTDLKLYFQVGASADLLIGGREVGSKIKSTTGYRAFDSSVILGGGVRYALGENTALMLGLRYTRGLMNTLTKPENNNFKVTNDMISLDFGIMF